MEPQNKSNKIIGVSISLIVVIFLVYLTMFRDNRTNTPVSENTDNPTVSNEAVKEETPVEQNTQNIPTPDNNTTSVQAPIPVDTNKQTVQSSVYKDGTYSATGTYSSPGGKDEIAVSLTITNDLVTDVNTTIVSADGTSTRYINKFLSGYKQYVVGINIDQISITKVSGSSLTSKGFNSALEKIKAEAKV